MYTETCMATLRAFVDGEGRLTKYPSKRRLKRMAWWYLATRFATGRRYTENEVNACLKMWHTFGDWCLLRRDMVDSGFLHRAPDGSAYWREETLPVPV